MQMSQRNADQWKVCPSCGRRFQWRKKWANSWDSVRFCSQRCRRHRPAMDESLAEDEIVALMGGKNGRIDSQALWAHFQRRFSAVSREEVKSAARRLAHRGEVAWFRRGKRVDPCTCTGDFELRAVRR